MTSRHWRRICTVLAAITTWSPEAALAIPSFQTDAFSQLSDSSGVTDEFTFSNPLPVFNNSVGTEISGAQVRAGSAVKSVRAQSSVSGASVTFFSAFSLIHTSYRDTFVMSAIGFDGQPVLAGEFTATANFSGAAEASGGGQHGSRAIIGAQMSVNNIGQGFIEDATSNVFGTDSPGTLARPVFITIPWFAGQPVSLFMAASAEASGSSGSTFSPTPGFFSANADIFSTIEWTGIVDVTDRNGNPVASFTALNDQGLDYATGLAAAVAEPAMLGLFGFGLAGIVTIKRARRSSRPESKPSSKVPA